MSSVSNDRNALRRAFVPRSSFVRVTSKGFVVHDELHTEMTATLHSIQLIRKLFENGSLSCDSPDGTQAHDGTLCDECRHPQFRPQLRLEITSGSESYVLDLSSTSARNLFAIEDEVEEQRGKLMNCTLRMLVIDRGHWGEVCFERI